MAEVNWVSLSVMTVVGTLKRATQLVMNATMHLTASMLQSSTATTCQWQSTGTHGPLKKQVEDPSAWEICMLGPEWCGAAGCLWTSYRPDKTY
jgi:hypothetical protein